MVESNVADMQARALRPDAGQGMAKRAVITGAGAVLLGVMAGGAVWLGGWRLADRRFAQRHAAIEQEVADDQAQLKAFRQFAMSFQAKMADVTSVDQAGQFASATIRFHALPAVPEMSAATNIRRWSYSFSKIGLYQVYFVVLVFDRPYKDFKVSVIQHDGAIPVTVGDASERTVLLQFIGEPAERAVTVNILPR